MYRAKDAAAVRCYAGDKLMCSGDNEAFVPWGIS